MAYVTPQERIEALTEAWTPTHTKILLLHSEGKPIAEISREVKLRPGQVKSILKSPNLAKNLQLVKDNVVQTVVGQRLEMMSVTTLKKAREMLSDASNMAVANIVCMAKGTIEGSRIQLEACRDILDRCGIKALVVTETRERVYSPEEVSSAKKVLDEAQDIVARLSNNTSPFILGDSKNKESS